MSIPSVTDSFIIVAVCKHKKNYKHKHQSVCLRTSDVIGRGTPRQWHTWRWSNRPDVEMSDIYAVSVWISPPLAYLGGGACAMPPPLWPDHRDFSKDELSRLRTAKVAHGHKKRSFQSKMHQKPSGGRALPGPAGGAWALPQTHYSRIRGLGPPGREEKGDIVALHTTLLTIDCWN